MTAGTTNGAYKAKKMFAESKASLEERSKGETEMKNTDVTLNPVESRPSGAYDRGYKRIEGIIEEMHAVTELIEKKVFIITKNVPYEDAEAAPVKSDRSPLDSVSPMGDNLSTIFAGLVSVLEKLEAVASNIVG